MNFKFPKILHLYWGKNKPLSYMKYLTVVSFSKLNPDWKIIVYFPNIINKEISWNTSEQISYNYNDIDYFDRLNEIPNLIFKKTEFKTDKNLSEVHKSDLLRLNVLSTIGGIWSDFDIFYVKPINSFSFTKNKDTFICYHNFYHSIGFLISGGNNQFFNKLLELAIYNINNIDNLKYQDVGGSLYSYFFRYSTKNAIEYSKKFNVNISNIPFSLVYPFNWKQCDLMFENLNFSLPENTIGIHWFAGNEKVSKYENIITKKNINEFDNKYLLKLMGESING